MLLLGGSGPPWRLTLIKLDRWASINEEILARLNRYAVADRPKRWLGKARAVLEFKREVLSQGLLIQANKCGWCTLPVGEDGRRTAHRDHIAPKGVHPKWTFLPKNIIVACEFCNGFAVKGEIDTVSVVSDEYDACIFHVVHPYLDEPSAHISFRDGGVLIQSLSAKGAWTIEKLKLDSSGLTTLRAKEFLYDRYKAGLSQGDKDLFEEASRSLA